MLLSRGLAALTLLVTLFLNPLFAEYLYKDDVINNSKLNVEVNTLAEELFEKTGIHLYLVFEDRLENNQSIADYEKELLATMQQPAVLLTFVEDPKAVDIIARPVSLYEDFNKKQILSPSSGIMAAIVNAVMFSRSYDEAKELLTTSGGVILPVLGQKVKPENIIKQYSVAMYNGYSEVAEQIAASHGVTLEHAAGNTNKNTLFIIKIIFYGIILYSILSFFRARRRKKIEIENSRRDDVKQ